MTDFTAETAIVWDGWDPRYARVLDVQVNGAAAAALIETNGDGADVNVDLYERGHDARWVEVASGNGSIETSHVRALWTADNRLILTHLDQAAE